MKLSVLYYSKTGTTEKMAAAIAAGASSVEGAEAKAFSIDEIDEAFLKESSCVMLGTPTYLASMSGAVKTWLETQSLKYGLTGKLGGAFATADYVHGGGELAIRGILDHMMVLGMPVFSGGGGFGKPVIHLGPVAIKENADDFTDTFKLYGQRMATKTLELYG